MQSSERLTTTDKSERLTTTDKLVYASMKELRHNGVAEVPTAQLVEATGTRYDSGMPDARSGFGQEGELLWHKAKPGQ